MENLLENVPLMSGNLCHDPTGTEHSSLLTQVAQRSPQSTSTTTLLALYQLHTYQQPRSNRTCSFHTESLIRFSIKKISYISPSSYSHIPTTFKARKSNTHIEDKLQQDPKVIPQPLLCCVSVETQRI